MSDERPDSEAEGQSDKADARETAQRAKEELFEAVEHFKSAASLMFERAANDPTLRQATAEAERVMRKVGETAEPLARQLTSELSRLTKRISETIQHSMEGNRKDEVVPPSDDPDR